MKSAAFTTLALALFVASCAMPPAAPTDQTDVARSEAHVALQKRAPTLTLDAQAKLADPTTLQLLEERSQDLAKAKKRVDELESELQKRATDLERVKEESKSKAQEKEQLEGLLREATDNERAASEKAIAAEIARLKFEQEVLKMRLGNLMRENP